MAAHGVQGTSLADFELDLGAVGGDHDPILRARDGFLRCETCGRTVSVAAIAEQTVRRALARLAETTCERHELPDIPAGEHEPRVTPEPSRGVRKVVCESCCRTAPIRNEGERALRALAPIPCVDGWSHRELLDAVFGPTIATPSLAALGIDAWRGLSARNHGEGVVRAFRHGGFQYTLYTSRGSGEGPTVTLRSGPSTSHEALDELTFPNADPSDPATRSLAIRLVTFLAATDHLQAGEFAELLTAHESARMARRAEWLDRAYDAAADRFTESVGGSPAAFAETFADDPDDTREVLRRVVGSGGFEDLPEDEFAVEQLGHRPEFSGLFEYVADRYGWTPPVAER
jgi:hypothetical protein